MKAYLFLAFFLLQLFSFKPVSAGVLEQVCKYIGDSYAYSSCLSIIGADPRSKTVKDIHDVALIAVDISIDRAVKVESYATMLIDNTHDKDTEEKALTATTSYDYTIKNVKTIKESLIAKVHPGGNSVAYVAQHSEDFTGSLSDLSKLEREFDDAFYVLSTLIDHM